MANISWTSSSINSFFNTSLGNPTSAFGSLYSCLGDASLIKRGTYHKLMDSYYSSVKNSDSKADTSSKTDTSKDSTSTDKTTTKKTHANNILMTVLQNLLRRSPTKYWMIFWIKQRRNLKSRILF